MKNASASLSVMASLGNGRSTRSVVRKKLYKSSIQKAKETLRLKMMKTGLAKMIDEKRVMANSLMVTKRDAAQTEANFRLLNTRRNELRYGLISRINDLVSLQAMETLLMLNLGLL